MKKSILNETEKLQDLRDKLKYILRRRDEIKEDLNKIKKSFYRSTDPNERLKLKKAIRLYEEALDKISVELFKKRKGLQAAKYYAYQLARKVA